MPRYFIELAYKGTVFCGFQKQSNQLSIQGEVDDALNKLLPNSTETTTSSRTDSGVHAHQNYLHFDCDQDLDNTKTVYQLNSILHPDILVHSLRKVPENAHARFDAISRCYTYTLYQRKNPFIREYGYFYPFPLVLDLLQASSSIYLKNEDFTSFSKKHTEVNNFICTLKQCSWVQVDMDTFQFTVEANRFLRGMVRALVGTSLLVGRKKISPSQLQHIIDAKDCKQADFSADAKGLTLSSVNYPKDLFLP